MPGKVRGAVRREATSVIGDARATGKRVNVIKEGYEAEQSVEEEVRVRVAVGADAPTSLALAVRDALLPVRPRATVAVAAAESAAIEGGTWDVAVVVGGGSDPAVATVARTLARAGVPVALVVESALDAPDLGLFGPTAARVTVVAGSGVAAVQEGLATWLVRATGKGVAMAANFPFCRRAQASALARECAGQNAAIGAFSLVPGSDLPVMAANQVRLGLTMAAMYGHGLSPARFVEGAAVVAASAAYRNVAKALGRAVPGLGWIVRAGVGYAGTMATARAMTSYFERVDVAGGVGALAAETARQAVGELTRQLPVPVPTGA